MDRAEQIEEWLSKNRVNPRSAVQALRQDSAKVLRARRQHERTRYGISVEEFLSRKRAEIEARERTAGRAVRPWSEIEQDATRRPTSDYGGVW